MDSSDNSGALAPPTRLVTAGRDTKAQKGFINPPVVHGSTVLYPTAEDLHAHRGEYQYGRHGTPTTRALQDTLMALEGPQCAGVGLAPSGLSAISTALLAVLKAGDHLLVTDSVYRPTRNFCNGLLARYGVETSYFDPLIGRGIERLFKQNTRAVLVEAPGSQSFEMPDIPAIAAAAQARGALVIDDNTWRRRFIIVPSNRASTSACRPPPNMSAATPTSCSEPSPPMPRPGRPSPKTSACSASAPVQTMSSWRCGACARLRCGSRNTTLPDLKWRAGCRAVLKSRGSCIRGWKAIRGTRSGSAISPAPAACSASC
jgi:hypothetical protein